jgi:hypothetical protein
MPKLALGLLLGSPSVPFGAKNPGIARELCDQGWAEFTPLQMISMAV